LAGTYPGTLPSIDSSNGKAQMEYRSRGPLIRELLRLLRTLDAREAKTAKELSAESGMELRQVYRWLKALDAENLIENFGNNPARYRLKPEGSRLRKRTGR
jgi:DNA-binding IclR family transcriptional regulator